MQIARWAPDAKVIVATDHVELATQMVQETTDFPPSRVFGVAGVLDSARFAVAISEATGVPLWEVEAMALGGQGAATVPLVSMSTVLGEALRHQLTAAEVTRAVDLTKGGNDVGRLAGGAHLGPAYAIHRLVEAIARNQWALLSCTVRSDGEYGTEAGFYTGLPVRVGAVGIEMVVPDFDLSEDELVAVRAASSSAAKLIETERGRWRR
jgi:malate dehydrogenase